MHGRSVKSVKEHGATVTCPHCGQEHPREWSHCPETGKKLHEGVALVGRVLAERYRITGVVGHGGMGTVYRAVHLPSARSVALKRLHDELTSEPRAVERFQREARAASATGHARIVDVLDVGFDDVGTPYIVMELLVGESLRERLRRGVVGADEAIEIAIQVLEGLEAVHANGIVHRDLKPANVFVTPDGIKLLDFGVSKFSKVLDGATPLSLTGTGAMMGTPQYMSPEQARGVRDIDGRADLYALGVMLYESLAGRRPFDEANYHALLRRIIGDDAPKLRSRAPQTPPALEELIHHALERDPRVRYADAASMREAFLRIRTREVRFDFPRRSSAPSAGNVPTAPTISKTPASDELARLDAWRASRRALDAQVRVASVKGRLVLQLADSSERFAQALADLDVQLAIAWVPQDQLEARLSEFARSELVEGGAFVGSAIADRLPWERAPLTRVLGRIPVLHRTYFSGNDLVLENAAQSGADLRWAGTTPGPHLRRLVAALYEALIGRAAGAVDVESHPNCLRIRAS